MNEKSAAIRARVSGQQKMATGLAPVNRTANEVNARRDGSTVVWRRAPFSGCRPGIGDFEGEPDRGTTRLERPAIRPAIRWSRGWLACLVCGVTSGCFDVVEAESVEGFGEAGVAGTMFESVLRIATSMPRSSAPHDMRPQTPGRRRCRHRPADYGSRSPAAQASTSRLNRRSRVSGRFASLIQKARILR